MRGVPSATVDENPAGTVGDRPERLSGYFQDSLIAEGY